MGPSACSVHFNRFAKRQHKSPPPNKKVTEELLPNTDLLETVRKVSLGLVTINFTQSPFQDLSAVPDNSLRIVPAR